MSLTTKDAKSTKKGRRKEAGDGSKNFNAKGIKGKVAKGFKYNAQLGFLGIHFFVFFVCFVATQNSEYSILLSSCLRAFEVKEINSG